MDELKTFSKKMIQSDLKQILEKFDVNDDGQVQLSPNPDDQFLSENEIDCIYKVVSIMSKNVVRNLSKLNVLPINFSIYEHCGRPISEYEVISFSLSGSMVLMDIRFSRVFRTLNGNQGPGTT